MPVTNLTLNFVSTLDQRPPESGRIEYCDSELTGFFLEHRASGKGTYYFRYRDSGRKTYQLRLGKLGVLSLADARAKAHQLRQQVDAGDDPQQNGHSHHEIPTLRTFVSEHYLPYVKEHKRSWDTDETLLRLHLLPIFGDKQMDRITRGEVTVLHQRLKQKGYAAGTCNRILVLLKFVFNCAIRWEIVPTATNPCTGIAPFPDYGARERYLSDEEVKRLLSELDSTRQTMVAQIVKLLLYTGARRSEIITARWEHIDLERQQLTVPISKSGKPRYVALSDAAVALLREVPRQPDIPWVFFNPRTRKPPVSIFTAWNTIRTKARIPDVRLHDLRHSYASMLVRAGRSLYEVQKLLGHYDPKVTMRYAHLSPRSLVDAANVVGAVMGG